MAIRLYLWLAELRSLSRRDRCNQLDGIPALSDLVDHYPFDRDGAGGGNVLIYLATLGSMPNDTMESACVEGANGLQSWWHVGDPDLHHGLASFFWPFVVLGTSELFTLEVGLQTLQQQRTQDFGLTMARATLSAVPMIIVFFIFQQQIVRGLTFGAVKG